MLKRCAAVLDPLTKASPGLLQGLYLMARVRYLSGIQNIVEINFWDDAVSPGNLYPQIPANHACLAFQVISKQLRRC